MFHEHDHQDERCVSSDRHDPNFEDIKRRGGPRHRGSCGFHYNNQKQHPPIMNHPCYPHLNDKYPNVPPHNFGREQFPVSGHMQENAFMLIQSSPYLWDNTTFYYGQRVCVGESVYTRVLQRKDPSCINLSGVFDMTQSVSNNVTLNYYLEQIVKNQFHQLEGLLPIIKSKITYHIFYTVTDFSGGVVYKGNLSSTNMEHRFHSTEVKNHYVLSDNNVVTGHLAQIDFHGPYILTLEKITAQVHVIDTKKHVCDYLNPFYQWTKNNQKIHIDSSAVSRHQSDFMFTIAEAKIGFSTQFEGNLTTKLKISFTTFLSDIISTHNVFDVWKQMYDTDGAVIKTMKHEIHDLKKDTKHIDRNLMDLEDRVSVAEDDIGDIKDNYDLINRNIKIERDERIQGDEMLSQYVDNETVNRINEIGNVNQNVGDLDTRVTTIEETADFDNDDQLTWEKI